MARKKVSTTVYLTEDAAARLKALNEAQKVPQPVFIREAIERQLTHWERVVSSGGQITFDVGGGATEVPENPS